MSRWKTVFAASLACATLLFAGGKEEAAVRLRIQEFQEAFNKHDAKALAAFFTKEGDLIGPTGVVATGSANIGKLITSEMEDIAHNAKTTLTVQRIRFLKPDICIVNMLADFTGGVAADGRSIPPIKALATIVAFKTGNAWMWEAGRLMLPTKPLPPAEQTAAPGTVPQ